MTFSKDAIKEALKLYLVMGLEEKHGRSAIELAKEAISGGVTCVQLREKKLPLREVIKLGEPIRNMCRELGIPFLVNDRVDVAMILEADGVHVGQDDLPGSYVRRLIGPDKWIGISASSMDEAEWAMSENPDYLGIGSIFRTQSKSDAGDPVGVNFIQKIRLRWPDIPLVGIGGIEADNAADVIRAQANGVAVISAITNQPNPFAAASIFIKAMKQV